MGNVWNEFCAKFLNNWQRDTSFQAKNLKYRTKIQAALARKLIARGEWNFQI